MYIGLSNSQERYKRTCMVKMPLKFINLKKKTRIGRKSRSRLYESTQGAGFLAKYCSERKAILRRNKRKTNVVLQQHACVCSGEVSGEPHPALKSFLTSPSALRLGQQRGPAAQHLPWESRCFFQPALEGVYPRAGRMLPCITHRAQRGRVPPPAPGIPPLSAFSLLIHFLMAKLLPSARP